MTSLQRSLLTLQKMTSSSSTDRLPKLIVDRSIWQPTRIRTKLSPEQETQWNKKKTHHTLTAHIHHLINRHPRSTKETTAELLHLLTSPLNRQRLSVTSFNLALSYAARVNDRPLMKRVMQLLDKSGLTPCTQTLNTVLGYYVRTRDRVGWNGALEAFGERGIAADGDTWNQLLSLSTKERKKDRRAAGGEDEAARDAEAGAILKCMEGHAVPQTSATLSIVLPTLRKKHNSPRDFLQCMWQYDLSCPRYSLLCDRIVDLLVDEGEHQLALEFIAGGTEFVVGRRLRQPSVTRAAYHKILKYAGGSTLRRRAPSFARGVMSLMLARAFEPNQWTFQLLLRIGLRAKRKMFCQMILQTALERDMFTGHMLEMCRNVDAFADSVLGPSKIHKDRQAVTLEQWIASKEDSNNASGARSFQGTDKGPYEERHEHTFNDSIVVDR